MKKRTLRKGSMEHTLAKEALDFMEQFGIAGIQMGSRTVRKENGKIVESAKVRSKQNRSSSVRNAHQSETSVTEER